MNILLVFDYESYVLYIPDNYISDIQKIHLDFFEWLEDQKENIVDAGGRMALSYGPNDFLRYINNVILLDSKEVAYFLPKTNRIKIHRKLRF